MPYTEKLQDPDDKIFLEMALTEQVDYLITGNLKHYPQKYKDSGLIISPAKFIEIYSIQKKENSTL